MIDEQVSHPGNSGWTVEHGANGDARVKDAEGVESGRVLRSEGQWAAYVIGHKGSWDHVCTWDSFHVALQDVFDELWHRATGIEFYRKPWPKGWTP